MLKCVDNVVYELFLVGMDLEIGFYVMGVLNGGVGYVLDEYNVELILDDMKMVVDVVVVVIVDGLLVVYDYMLDEICLVLDF